MNRPVPGSVDWWWNFYVLVHERTAMRLGFPTRVHALRFDSMTCRLCGRTALDIVNSGGTA